MGGLLRTACGDGHRQGRPTTLLIARLARSEPRWRQSADGLLAATCLCLLTDTAPAASIARQMQIVMMIEANGSTNAISATTWREAINTVLNAGLICNLGRVDERSRSTRASVRALLRLASTAVSVIERRSLRARVQRRALALGSMQKWPLDQEQ